MSLITVSCWWIVCLTINANILSKLPRRHLQIICLVRTVLGSLIFQKIDFSFFLYFFFTLFFHYTECLMSNYDQLTKRVDFLNEVIYWYGSCLLLCDMCLLSCCSLYSSLLCKCFVSGYFLIRAHLFPTLWL